MQGYSIPKTLILAIISLTLSSAPKAAAQKTSDVAVLIDRSLSLEIENRDEALNLIAGILDNELPAGLVGKWRFVPNTAHLNDPDAIEFRSKLQESLAAALKNESGEFHVPSPRLLLGSIGDLDTVMALTNADWQNRPAASIVEYGVNASPSDPETHYELGRAIISSKLDKGENYFLFVVSDGVEDLLNKSVSFYLDPAKLADPASLEKTDFLDSANIGILRNRNAARKRGEEITRDNGKVLAGYDLEQQGYLSRHRDNYDEMLIGRFSLNPGELAAFFTDHSKKVPVFVEVYRNSPRPNLSVSFVKPETSSLEEPHQLAQGNSELAWQVASKNDAIASMKLTIESINATGDRIETLSEEAVTEAEGSLDLLKQYPTLNGIYRTTFDATTSTLSKKAVAFVTYDRPVVPNPAVTFTKEPLLAADKPVTALDLSRQGSDFTSQAITWVWKLDEAVSTKKPETLEWMLEGWDDERNQPTTDDSLERELKPTDSKITVADIISARRDDYFPFYGRTCRFTLRGTWKDGSPSEAVAFLRFPEIDLQILGRSDFKESADSPRIVKKDEWIKIWTWMHPSNEKTMKYSLDLEEWKDDKWVSWDRDGEPLAIDFEENGARIVVKEPFEGKIRYTVNFKYYGSHSKPDDDRGDEEGILLAEAEGYVAYESFDWLPIIMAVFAALALGLFFWNLRARRAR